MNILILNWLYLLKYNIKSLRVTLEVLIIRFNNFSLRVGSSLWSGDALPRWQSDRRKCRAIQARSVGEDDKTAVRRQQGGRILGRWHVCNEAIASRSMRSSFCHPSYRIPLCLLPLLAYAGLEVYGWALVRFLCEEEVSTSLWMSLTDWNKQLDISKCISVARSDALPRLQPVHRYFEHRVRIPCI